MAQKVFVWRKNALGEHVEGVIDLSPGVNFSYAFGVLPGEEEWIESI
ncbi:MAG TPA: hypothetical protein VF207_00615 [Chthoniobacterales bacterium]